MKRFGLANHLVSLSTFCIITTTAHAGIPVWSFSPNESPVVTVSPTETKIVSYTLKNNSKKPHQLMLSFQTPTGISQLGGPCFLAAKSPAHPNPTCTLTLSITGSALPADHVSGGPVLCQVNGDWTPNAHQCYQPSPGDTLVITRAIIPGTTTLSTSIASPSILALSVNNPSLNPALTGNARQITISNTGTNEATDLTIAYPIWPGGTTATSTCGASLAAGVSCTITITPGSEATSSCNTGIAPTPGTITVSAGNVATALTSNVVVLNYGCQYQGGFLYSVDDTTNNGVTGTCLSPPCTRSIGGKVVSVVDQSTGIVWSVDYTTILGIDDKSTPLNPSPAGPAYPPGTPAYIPCNGVSDGACNSGNILSYYNHNSASTDDYAAGLCTASINSYSDWYLPAICEMDTVNSLVLCPLGAQSIGLNLAFLVGNLNAPIPSISCNPPVGTVCLAGSYWSSTENTYAVLVPQFEALSGEFNLDAGGSYQNYYGKANQLGVRCSRVLTL